MALGKGYIDLVSTNGSLTPLFTEPATQDAPAAPAGAQPVSVDPNPSTPTSPEPGNIQDPKDIAPDGLRDQHKPAASQADLAPAPACPCPDRHLLRHIGGWATDNNEIIANQLFMPIEPAT
ncbi:hypothetical protein TWF569_000826 [Orbilia oligospora]|uniref:Uncharacterized protein n=1 Tax=Orbilia oligospora TaxID=2813651 RepID=A0A7C8JXS7_ORBOL|nr:hypothetical protein TWF102_001957 [Orbilia oligospora]KAF3089887.1 hypothetical protein TWF706_010270 [Orbilia oligospora]KAF3094753.1 hypothetical protein TWF103_010463 [Orbilia oligospora]KAF3125384.1 hypothetical protein TWF569_000826 [Orbilia oligospora]KAF3138519.1 hypothetical protein TWF703_004566 [Orbilia oligospora]